MNFTALDSKTIVRDLLGRLPAGVSLTEIAQEIEFIAAVRAGIDEIERGEGLPLEQVAAELPTWLTP